MIKIDEDEQWQYDNQKQVSVSTYISRQLDGRDYEQGELEDLHSTVDKLHVAFGLLFELLETKKVLTGEEIKKTIQNIY